MKSILLVTWVIVIASPLTISQTKPKIATPVQSSTNSSGPGPSNEDPNWKKGWTNIVPANRTGQSFIAKSSTLSSIEVAILTTDNKTADKDTITMKILSEDGQVLIGASKTIDAGFSGWLRFEMPGQGLKVLLGQKLIIRLADTGKVVFGWKYGLDKYPDGTAIMVGAEDKRFDFLFKVNHQARSIDLHR